MTQFILLAFAVVVVAPLDSERWASVCAAQGAAIQRTRPEEGSADGSNRPMATSDGQGRTWTPDGAYRSKSADAKLDSSGGVSELVAGNACTITGKIVRSAGRPEFQFVGKSADGLGCPGSSGSALNATITVLDGPGVRALGNASKLRILHKSRKGKVNFSGVYEFEHE